MAKRPRMPRPATVSDLLAAVLRGTPTEARLREGAIWQIWDKAVGKKIAERARPVAMRDGVLTVVVSSAPWMQQLTFLKKGIIDKLNAGLREPLVREIYLKAGRPLTDPPPEKPLPAPRPLSSEERRMVAEETAGVTDPELRESFASLMAKHLSRTN